MRLKFKNLRMYFLNQHRKICDDPSGSAGCPGVKWPLYNAASFLLDAQVDLTSSKSTFVLPSTIGKDSDVALVQEVTLGEGCVEDGIILEEQQPGPSSVPNIETSAPTLTAL